ncbi:MAG: right-handed parallel beta-helix repeat-containing protein, partial [Thermoplasmata archaeon]|nr:right-handed parallel beta-helix repeat-containing protein [Thermoplasmata archaeon]
GHGQWVRQSDGLEQSTQRVVGYFCDVNNDGNLDIAASVKEGAWCYLGDGNGTWTNSSEGLPGANMGFGSPVSYGDFNNDGFIDLAMSVGGRTYAFAGDGTGHWTDSSGGLPSYDYVSLKLADMNNDKNDDLVGLLRDSRTVELYLASGNGGWVKAQTTVMQGNADGCRLNVGDFDHNGHPDIVAGFGSDNSMNFPGSVKVWKETSVPSELDVTLTYPDGGEYLKAGSIHFIRWLSAVPTGTGTRSVKLELSTGGESGPWSLIEDCLPDTGIYQWTVPDEESGDCYIRVTLSDNLGDSASDVSDNAFGIEESASGGDRDPHQPISIGSDAEWTPDNGVRSGSGTEADPYIIERWDIIGGDSTCLSIRNTRRYAIIRDNRLHHASGLRHGITLNNAENLTIDDNDIDNTHHGIHIGATEVLITNNRITDIGARGVMASGYTNRLTAIGNLLRNTGVYGFNLDGSGFMTPGEWKYPALLENNTISGASNGLYLHTASGTFRGNTIFNTRYGVHCTIGMSSDKAVNCTFEDNVLKYNTFGMYVSLPLEPWGGGRSWAVVKGNLFERNIFRGLWLGWDANYTVENNTCALNAVGIDDLAFGNQTFRNNTIKFNLGGLMLRALFRIDPSRENVQKVRIMDNDIFNNAYFGIRNDYYHAPGEVDGNYYGGVPGEDGDLVEGNVGGGYRTTPNDPDTPDIFSSVTVVDKGESESITSDTTLDTNYFIRKGGSFDISGANVDLGGKY